MMEKYFEITGEKHYNGEELEDIKPEYHYLVGAVPENVEMARNHAERIRAYAPENKPMSPLEPVFDAKWRFHWKIGKRPEGAVDDFP